MQSPRNRAGFTLLEVMIVVVILGILASTVLPQFANTQGSAQEASLATTLATVRSQIQVYKMQHNGKLPGYNGSTQAALTDCLLKKTDLDGTVNNSTGLYGPYLTGALPPNPFTGLTTVTVAASDTTPDGTSSGWLYNSLTGTFKPNNTLTAPSGKNFSDF